MDLKLVKPNGTPIGSDPKIAVPEHVMEQYAKEAGELMEAELDAYLKSIPEDKANKLQIEVIGRAPDKAIVVMKRKCIRNQFPQLKWVERAIPKVLFKNIDEMNQETEVVRYWEK